MIKIIPLSAIAILILFLPFNCDNPTQCSTPTEQGPRLQEYRVYNRRTDPLNVPEYVYDPNTQTCAASKFRVGAFNVDCNKLPKEVKTYFGIVEK
jgi:hypothetical protein